MKQQASKVIVILTIVLVGAVYMASAQEPVLPEQPAEDVRFEFMPHNYYAGGFEQEIFLKLDSYTGQTWRFHASNPRWSPIPEPKQGSARQAGIVTRYELFTHDFMDQNGDEQQLVMRVDSVTGNTWTYRGATAAWSDIPQDEPVAAQPSPPVAKQD